MKFIELVGSLKQKICPLYNIIGDDAFLIRQAISNIKKAVVTDLEEFNFAKLDADKMKSGEFNAIVSTMPISSEHRLVVLVNPSNELVKEINKTKFEDNLTVIVAINAEKLTGAEVIDCSKLDKLDIQKYVLNALSKNNLSITEQALDYLIEATGGVMSYVVSELGKIVSYSKDKEIIDIDVVTNLVASTTDYAVYQLTNAIDNKDFKTYQTILSDLKKYNTYGEIFSYMGRYFRRMQYIVLNKDDAKLASILGIKPYAVKMSRQAIQKNGINYYLNLYKKYIELDYKIKNGQISPNNALYELIF